MPVIKINTNNLKSTGADFDTSYHSVRNTWLPHEGAFWMLVTKDTYDAFNNPATNTSNTDWDALADASIKTSFDRKIWDAYAPESNRTAIVLESGLDTSDIPKNDTSRNNLINGFGLSSKIYYVDLDTRLFVAIWSPSGGGSTDQIMVQNPSTGDFSFGVVTEANSLGSTTNGVTEVFNYVRTDILAKAAEEGGTFRLVETDSSVTPTVSTYSVINGPSADFTALVPQPNITRLATSTIDSLWTDLGKQVTGAQLLRGSSGTFALTQFHVIDTVVYVHQASTNTSTQFTIKLVRKA